MPALTVHNISEEIHLALKARALQHGRSTEAEIRAILEAAVLHTDKLQIGTALKQLGHRLDLADDDVAIFDRFRSASPADPLDLG
jgi:plasmid stability protein